MDFTTSTEALDRATNRTNVRDGDVVVATRAFDYRGVRIPRGATAIYRNPDMVEVQGRTYTVDPTHLYNQGVRITEPGITQASTPDAAPGLVPDVLNRDEVEALIRQYAREIGYPRYGETLIGRLPGALVTSTWTVTVTARDGEVDADLISERLQAPGLQVVAVRRS